MNTKHIWTDPKRCGGVPCIRGHRFSVAQLLGELAESRSAELLCHQFDFNLDEVWGVLQDLGLHINDLAHTGTYCAYCGYAIPDDADASLIGQHIQTCDKHPIAIYRMRIAELEALLRQHIMED